MPAWIIVARSGEDENDPNWVTSLKAWHWEVIRIIERFDMDSQHPPEYKAVLVYNDNSGVQAYHVQIVFGYGQLAQY